MKHASESLRRGIRLRSATLLVIANMVGAGIFTTTGFQAESLGHPGWIFVLWLTGGILALCGALCYAELGAAMPEAGAEYAYLREAYGPAFGFMSAFVSLIAGFSAPIASALKSFVRYLTHFAPGLAGDAVWLGFIRVNDWVAIGLVWLLVGIHLRGTRYGFRFNDFVTLAKVAGILLIIAGAITFGSGSTDHFVTVSESYDDLGVAGWLGAMATGLIFVMFCYSGWNAAAYVAGEIEAPQRTLPRALLLGTGTVTVLYLALNAVYIYGAGVDDLAGKVEVGLVAARGLFGPAGTSLITAVLLVSLLAAASAMTVAGPRVYYALGRDSPALHRLAAVSSNQDAPRTALILQGLVTSVIILSGRVDQIQQYAGFSITLFSCLAVSSVLILRHRRPDMPRPFRTWGYPVTPVLFLTVAVWAMIWNVQERPLESMLSLATVAAGGFVYHATKRTS